jgi:hypothetical protein
MLATSVWLTNFMALITLLIQPVTSHFGYKKTLLTKTHINKREMFPIKKNRDFEKYSPLQANHTNVLHVRQIVKQNIKDI